MANKTRKLMRRRIYSCCNNSSITCTKDEPYALCFYLYNIFEDRTNTSIMNDDEDVIKCFLKYTKTLNKTERLGKVLDFQINKLVEQKILKPLPTPVNEGVCFDDGEIPYCFEQDKKIDRAMRRYDDVDETLINLLRVLYCTEKPVFSSIINSTIFGNGSDYSLRTTLKLSSKLENAIFDISKTRFLMDQVKLNENEARYILLKSRFDTIEDLRTIARSYENEVKALTAEMIGVSPTELK